MQGCLLVTEFVNTVQSKEDREALVQVVEYHRKIVSGFTKKELETFRNIFVSREP